ncbi:hypothetical protein HUJ05_001767 [Dendroctonus ponderosae]|nr:hypothetical protein HUJ05_001767 [Dendroctonus ponderosae]
MNTFQKQMIQQFPYTITIDSTHGLNGYDFELTTIMVLDEYHHGFPVAEMFTNRKDTVVQSIFFSAIKKSVGILISILNAPTYFVSSVLLDGSYPFRTIEKEQNMAEVFFNAWFGLMELPCP